jgi:hypothetical protein
MDEKVTNCQKCSRPSAHRYQSVSPAPYPFPATTTEQELCPACARQTRRQLISIDRANPHGQLESDSLESEWTDRQGLLAHLDRFFAEAGIFEICARCHDQGTGCCPPTCRVMGARGCDPENGYGKTVFCAAFLCSALLNAISEVDPECGRILRWVKEQLGPAEFHIYEMITRVPAAHREPERPLQLPARYPLPLAPPLAEYSTRLRAELLPLVDEILAVRRLW